VINQRGYNIVEMSIALVVLALLLGGGLVPLQRYYEDKNNQKTESLMNAAQDAVVSYSVRHRTVVRELEDHGGFNYVLAAGRPYLPCPDIDNDGAEDRVDVPNSALFGADLLTRGVCQEQKGALPWKTLGLPDTDTWGNRLTYLVDEAFSSSLIGFDSKTQADVFDVRRPLDYSSGEGRYQLRDSQDDAGAIICKVTDISLDTSREECGFIYNLWAGVVLPGHTTMVTIGARVFDNTVEPNGVVEGMPFVIVSHGRNGYGAIGRNGNCRDVLLGAVEEQENAYLNPTHSMVSRTNSPCPNNDVAGGILSRFVDSVHGNRGGEKRNFDDIVAWMSSDQLMGSLLRHGVFPVTPLDFLPE
jgi:prepilin-type N-terminal cleavage/methylation domain-containing protein